MTTRKLLTRLTLGLSLCAFCYPVLWSLYVIHNYPATLRSLGGEEQVFRGGVGLGILFFSVVWITYGVVRWLVILPIRLVAQRSRGSIEDGRMGELRDNDDMGQ